MQLAVNWVAPLMVFFGMWCAWTEQAGGKLVSGQIQLELDARPTRRASLYAPASACRADAATAARPSREDASRAKIAGGSSTSGAPRCFVKAVDRLNCRATLSPRDTVPRHSAKTKANCQRWVAILGGGNPQGEPTKQGENSYENFRLARRIRAASVLPPSPPQVAFAGAPKNQADCEKAHMKWDATAKKCSE